MPGSFSFGDFRVQRRPLGADGADFIAPTDLAAGGTAIVVGLLVVRLEFLQRNRPVDQAGIVERAVGRSRP